MVVSGIPRIHGFAELVLETLSRKISLFLGNPFLQPEMRRDDEFAHFGFLSLFPSLSTRSRQYWRVAEPIRPQPWRASRSRLRASVVPPPGDSHIGEESCWIITAPGGSFGLPCLILRNLCCSGCICRETNGLRKNRRAPCRW